MTNRKIRALGQVYGQCQRSRVACDLQMQELEEDELLIRGLAKKETLSEEERAEHNYRKTKVVISDEEQAEEVLKALHETREYSVLAKHRAILKSEELRFLATATELFSDSAIWQFCKSVKGLGDVAALTFFTVLNTEEIARRSGSRVITAGALNKYLGLVPGQKLESGKLGGFNTIMKGRTWVISRNVIMANDPYYSQLYRIQKELYRNRPDIIAENGYVVKCPQNGHFIATQQKIEFEGKKEGGDDHLVVDENVDVYCPICKENVKPTEVVSHKTRPGWAKWTDAMASRWMRKTLLSHVTEIIATSEGYEFSKHSNYIPPKPEFMEDQQDVLVTFRRERLELLDKYIRLFAETGNAQTTKDNMLSYWEQK